MSERYNSDLSVLVKDLGQPWSLERFQVPHKPYVLGELTYKADMVLPTPSVINMPIKNTQEGMRIPSEIVDPKGEKASLVNRALIEFLVRTVEMEEKINPYFASSYAYLTIDQREVAPGYTQRDSGIHIDGMQGERYITKRPPCHLYAVASSHPTKFYYPPLYLTNLNHGTDNFYTHINEQSKHTKPFTPPPFTIAFFSAYSAHESPIIDTKEPITRTFYRIEFTQKDPYGGTFNPLLPDFPYGDRSLSKNLAEQRKEKSREAPRA